MRGMLWALGRTLQMLAMLLTGYALVIGLSGGSMQNELTLLLVGVGVFGAGLLLCKFTQGDGS